LETENEAKVGGTTPAFGLDLLDDLIEVSYLTLKDKLEEFKIGDWLKMLECRRKLSPEGREKEELWDLLQKIRNSSIDRHPVQTQTTAEPSKAEEEAA
jgi:hypothetical protein